MSCAGSCRIGYWGRPGCSDTHAIHSQLATRRRTRRANSGCRRRRLCQTFLPSLPCPKLTCRGTASGDCRDSKSHPAGDAAGAMTSNSGSAEAISRPAAVDACVAGLAVTAYPTPPPPPPLPLPPPPPLASSAPSPAPCPTPYFRTRRHRVRWTCSICDTTFSNPRWRFPLQGEVLYLLRRWRRWRRRRKRASAPQALFVVGSCQVGGGGTGGEGWDLMWAGESGGVQGWGSGV